MKISCPNCQRIRDIGDAEFGRKIECCCSHRFILDETCVVNEEDLPAEAKEDAPPKVSESIGPYKLESVIGKGAMGTVYKSVHPQLNIPVAVKALLPKFAKIEKFADRFINSVKLCAKLVHPNIIRIYDCGKEGETLYLVMEYVDGGSVLDLLGEWNRLEVGTVIEVGISVCEALIEAEKLEIVHRDIKPENLMRSKEGEFKLADLGLARQISQGVRVIDNHTVEYSTLGTPHYMPPEQALDATSCDTRSDIYALGVSMYELVTGQLPFLDDDLQELARRHKEDIADAPSNLNREIPPDFDKVIWKCMEKKPEDRYQTPAELLEDLEHLKRNEPVSVTSIIAFPSSAPIPGTKSRVPNKKWIWVVILVLLGIFIAGIAGLTFNKFFPKPPPGPKPDDKKGIKPKVITKKMSALEIRKEEARKKQQRQKEIWNFAVNFAEKATKERKDFKLAIANFAAIRDGSESAAYIRKAEKEIQRLEAARQDAVKVVLDELTTEVQPLTAERKFQEAAKVYQEYSGPLSNETKEERKKLAEGLLKNTNQDKNGSEKETQKTVQEKPKPMEKITREVFLEQLTDLLLNGEYSQANDELRDNAEKFPMPLLKEPISELANANQIIGKWFSDRIEKTIYIQLGKEKLFLVVKKIDKQGVIYAEETTGKAKIIRKFTINELTPDDRGKCLLELNKTARRIFMGVEYYRKGKLKTANKSLKDAGPLGRHLSKRIQELQKTKKEQDAARDYQLLLKQFGYETTPPAGGISTRELLRKIPPKKLGSAFNRLNQYRKKYSKSKFYKERAKLLEDLSTAMGHAIDSLKEKKEQNKNPQPKNAWAIKKPRDFYDALIASNSEYNGKGEVKFSRTSGWIIDLNGAEIDNLRPLRGLKIKILKLNNNPIEDLSPLRGAKLHTLWIVDTKVSDLSPLEGMPLKYLKFTPKNITDPEDLKMLRQMKSLIKIGTSAAPKDLGKKPALFWKEYDEGKKID